MEQQRPQGGEPTPDHFANYPPGQEFAFGPWIFDIDQAITILRERPREPQSLSVELWAPAYGVDSREDSRSIPLVGRGPEFDPDYALTTSLGLPLIIATLDSPEIGEHALLIDGTHRLYKAYVEGVAELPAYVLSTEETLDIRVERWLW